MPPSADGASGARIAAIFILMVLSRVLGDPHNNNKNFHESSLGHPSTVPKLEYRFAHSIYNVSIPENSVGKTIAVQPSYEDRLGITITPDLDVKYRIISGDKERLFKADERIVGDFAFLAIRTRTGNVILNREKIDEYRLDVRASISRRDSKSKIIVETDTLVIVKVLDTNDLSPLFYPTEYSISVPEDTPLHKSIIKVTAEDADLGINGEIYYSFLEATDYFAVHPTSGLITLTRPLKFTDRSVHELIVVAADRGSANNNRLSQASKAKVHIKVKQVSTVRNSLNFEQKSLEIFNKKVYKVCNVLDLRSFVAFVNSLIFKSSLWHK